MAKKAFLIKLFVHFDDLVCSQKLGKFQIQTVIFLGRFPSAGVYPERHFFSCVALVFFVCSSCFLSCVPLVSLVVLL